MSTLIKAGQGLAIFLALTRKKKFHPRSQKDRSRIEKKRRRDDSQLNNVYCDRDLFVLLIRSTTTPQSFQRQRNGVSQNTSLGVNMTNHADSPILGYFAPSVRPLEQTWMWGCEQDVADQCWRLFNIPHGYWVGEFADCHEACRAVSEVLGDADQWPIALDALETIEAWQEPIKPGKSGKPGKTGKPGKPSKTGKSGKSGKGFGKGGNN